MNTTNYAQTLLSPVIARAQACTHHPWCSFKDRAAEALVDNLDLKSDHSLNIQANDRDLIRCIWIDKCILRFLKRHPYATGLNLSCGLNTRFHRLSQQLEWPRFSWVDIDTPEVMSFNHALLPNIDNYRTVGCDFWNENWLEKARWNPEVPTIISIESLALTASKSHLKKLFECIQQAINKHPNALLHVILDFKGSKRGTNPLHDSYAFLQSIKVNACNVTTTDLSLSLKHHGFLSWVSQLFTFTHPWVGLQFSIQPTTKNSIKSRSAL